MAYRSAIGIEISENVVIIAQIQSQDDELFVSHYKMVPIPPQSVSGGIIADPTLLADHVSTVLQDNDFSGDDVVVSLTDSPY
jgi:Tfp pilus assembly PilM family ATPase